MTVAYPLLRRATTNYVWRPRPGPTGCTEIIWFVVSSDCVWSCESCRSDSLQYSLTHVDLDCWLTNWITHPVNNQQTNQPTPLSGSRSCKANGFSDSLKSSLIVWNLKVYHRIHNSPPLVHILSLMYPVHAMPSCFFSIYLILSSHLWLGLPGSLASGFPRKPCIRYSCPPYVPHSPPISFFFVWSFE